MAREVLFLPGQHAHQQTCLEISEQETEQDVYDEKHQRWMSKEVALHYTFTQYNTALKRPLLRV